MMAKKNNKTNNSKKNNKAKKVLNQELLIIKQKEIEANANKIIDQLNIDFKKNFFNFAKKKEIKHLISELQNLINLKEFDVLSSKMKSLELLYENEKKDIKELDSNKKIKLTKPKFDFVNFFRTVRYPIFSRYRKIILEENGTNRIKKLCLVSGIIVLLVSVSVIGFLMYFGVIPGIAASSTETDNILPIFLFAVPIGLLFII
ncbi:MAG: hypothetical protein RR665_00925 [Malacoplasma sp.]